ncbi:uncharacterized protein LOC109534791 [Dendroctonus ponderosae]|uniref:Hemolymph juvenile hormone binding protein n=1 Tax=Dendroctonus ponderosae TaxID=77166 RepID=U4U0C8_DENPD|nr:uncharacterized protein LOC109534791 [Dendroctonus ponderosae]ERL87319.1 hypothetical protein D910_04714 [Dendroctonus ponderosae]
MKLPIVLLLCLTAGFASELDERNRDLEVTLNRLTDLVLPGLNRVIRRAGLDPIPLPDQSVTVRVGLLSYTSQLTEGSLSKLATLSRFNDVRLILEREQRRIVVDFNIGWPDLELNFDYNTRTPLVSLQGGVITNVENLQVRFRLAFNLRTQQFEVDDLDFSDTGKILLTFTGNDAFDHLADAMTNSFTNLFHGLILETVRKVALEPVQAVVDSINQAIDNVLRPERL